MRNQFQQDLRDPELDVPILAGSQNPSLGKTADSMAVCGYWLAGKCPRSGHHSVGKKLCLHEDIPGLPCSFGTNCWYQHYETRTGTMSGTMSGTMAGTMSGTMAGTMSDTMSCTMSPHAELKEGMAICVKDGSSRMPGKILEISQNEGLKVQYKRKGQEGSCQVEWLSLRRLLVPDFSQIEMGMQVTVEDAASGIRFHCRVLQVSNEKERACAPVYVHYNGYESEYDEWVGVDRLRSKSLIWHEPVLPSNESLGQPNGASATSRLRTVEQDAPGSTIETSYNRNGFDLDDKGATPLPLKDGLVDGLVPKLEDFSVGEDTDSMAVCGYWLAGKCPRSGHHSVGKKLCLHEDIPGLPCSFGTNCWYQHYETRTGTMSGTMSGTMAGTMSGTMAGTMSDTMSCTMSPHAELKEGMAICVKDGSSRMPGKILEISQNEGLKVQYKRKGQEGSCQVEWLSLRRLLVPDFSQIEMGMQVTVEDAASGIRFHCRVLQVSNEKERACAPVYVHYNGYESEYDEWVGVDRLRSKSLIWHEPVLPTDGMQGQYSERLGQPNGSAATLRWRTVERDPPASTAQSSNQDLQRPSVAQDVVSAAAAADLLDASASNAMPWHEPDSEADAFDRALQATEEALTQQAQAEEWKPKLEQTLAEVKTDALHDLLERHSWSGPGG